MVAWEWEKLAGGAVAGAAAVVALHPLDVVRTRFQVHDGRDSFAPKYRSTAHALLTITQTEGLRGLYAGLYPSLLGSGLSWGLYFFFYNNSKSRYQVWKNGELGPVLHLLSAAEAGVLVCILTNPVWLIKTRLQIQAPQYCARQPYRGFRDAFKSILKDEGWRAFYRGIGPSILLVSHGSVQFMAYEEGRKIAVRLRNQGVTRQQRFSDEALRSVDYIILGALSKFSAMILTYPYQVVRARIQVLNITFILVGPLAVPNWQRPDNAGVRKYANSWQAFKETLRHEGMRGLYKGFAPNLLKNVPASSITFVVYETVLKLWR